MSITVIRMTTKAASSRHHTAREVCRVYIYMAHIKTGKPLDWITRAAPIFLWRDIQRPTTLLSLGINAPRICTNFAKQRQSDSASTVPTAPHST